MKKTLFLLASLLITRFNNNENRCKNEKIFTDVIQNYEIEDNIKDIELVLLERIKI